MTKKVKEQVSVRISSKILGEIDRLAEENDRDRSSEINYALRLYTEQKLIDKDDIVTEIDKMSKKIEALEKEVQGLKE